MGSFSYNVLFLLRLHQEICKFFGAFVLGVAASFNIDEVSHVYRFHGVRVDRDEEAGDGKGKQTNDD